MDDLYFMLAGERVKIGRSTDTWRRQGHIQANNHEEVDCICRLVGRGYEERAWQAAFCETKVRGEWFERTWALDIAIGMARAGHPWWEHLKPPPEFTEAAPDPVEATVDWHILLNLYCRDGAELAKRNEEAAA